MLRIEHREVGTKVGVAPEYSGSTVSRSPLKRQVSFYLAAFLY